MPIFGGYYYRNLSRHFRHFERVCMAKGASRAKAESWARVQVLKKGRRAL